MGGREVRKSLAMRDWQKAQDHVREWEARETEPRSTSEPATIHESEEKYLADAVAVPERIHDLQVPAAVQAAGRVRCEARASIPAGARPGDARLLPCGVERRAAFKPEETGAPPGILSVLRTPEVGGREPGRGSPSAEGPEPADNAVHPAGNGQNSRRVRQILQARGSRKRATSEGVRAASALLRVRRVKPACCRE